MTMKVGNNLLIVAIVVFFILTLSAVQNLRQSSCSDQNGGISFSENWFVSPSTSSGRILWQRKLTISDSEFSVNSDTLVFFRGGNSDLCIKDNQLIALNPTTGEKVWSMPAKLVGSMVPLSDGYLGLVKV